MGWIRWIRRGKALVVAALGLVCGIHTAANDGAASIAAGGIRLRKEARVSMEKERLTIGLDKVIVEYEFLNTTDRDVVTEVAFPIPDYRLVPVREHGNPNFPDFRVWVDGQEISFKTETQALAHRANRMALLADLQIDVDHPEKYDERRSQIHGLSDANRQKLRNLGLISAGDDVPMWTVRKTHYWTMTFPAHRAVRVRHEYAPVWGSWIVEGEKNRQSNRILTRDACFEKSSVSPAASRQNVQLSLNDVSDPRDLVSITVVNYILTTANTWNGPIKDFELVVNTASSSLTGGSDADPLRANFCWDGPVARLDKYRVQASKENFVPPRDLSVFFVNITHPR